MFDVDWHLSSYVETDKQMAVQPCGILGKLWIVVQNEAISLVTVRSKELWLVEENHATVKPDSRVASRGMKTYSESRIELRNLSSQFLSSEQPCEPKSLDVALKIAEVEKPSENLWLRLTKRPFDSSFEWK